MYAIQYYVVFSDCSNLYFSEKTLMELGKISKLKLHILYNYR